MLEKTRAEDGATAVLVAICLLLLVGAGAIAIDLGSAWQTKRGAVVDTDAAALAGAQALVGGDCADAETAAEAFLAANIGDGAVNLLPGVDFFCDGTAGTVQVDLSAAAQQTLSGALGADSLDVFSSSTAQMSEGTPGGGLRPFSVCMTDPAISGWISGGAGTVHQVDVTKTWKNKASDNCQGGAPGNWGYVCYTKGKHNAGSCSATSVTALTLDGYDGSVDLGLPTPTDGDCDPETADADDCDPITGSINASHFQDALDTIACAVATHPTASDCPYQFAILGIDSFTGNGSNAAIHPTHFIGVVLRDWEIKGSGGFLEFELVNLFDEGTSAVISEGVLAEPSVALCDADNVDSQCT